MQALPAVCRSLASFAPSIALDTSNRSSEANAMAAKCDHTKLGMWLKVLVAIRNGSKNRREGCPMVASTLVAYVVTNILSARAGHGLHIWMLAPFACRHQTLAHVWRYSMAVWHQSCLCAENTGSIYYPR